MFLHVLLPGSSLIVNSMEVSGTSLFALLRASTMQDVTLFARKLAVKQSSAAARRKTDVIESVNTSLYLRKYLFVDRKDTISQTAGC